MSGTELWRKDLSETGGYMDIFGKYQPGNVKAIKIYTDKVCVIVGASVTCIKLEDGRLQWEHEMGSLYSQILIRNEIGCFFANGGYRLINMESGEWITHVIRLNKISLRDDDIILPTGRGFVFEGDYLWHDLSNGGMNYISAIDPLTGKYVWLEKIECRGEFAEPPGFYNDKMYIKTTEGDLLVFNKV
jgi:outer membrane protein assembly factor BamB